MYNDDVLSFCRLPVATVMTGLKLQIMTENNTPWDPLPTSSLVVKADWHKSATPTNKKKSKGKKSTPPTDPITSLFLPDIKVGSGVCMCFKCDVAAIRDCRLTFDV